MGVLLINLYSYYTPKIAFFQAIKFKKLKKYSESSKLLAKLFAVFLAIAVSLMYNIIVKIKRKEMQI